MASHNGYVISGQMRVLMDNGEQVDHESGDVMVIEPGYDAWILGNEPCIVIDLSGMSNYAKKQ